MGVELSGINEAYIEELAEDRRATFRDFHEEVRKNRLARYLKDMSEADVPEAYRNTTQVMQLPRIPDILQRMTALVTDDDPVLSQPPRDESETAQRDSSRVERWAGGAMRRMIEDADRDPWRNAVDAALCDGIGVMKLIDDQLAAWADEPGRTYEEEDVQGQKVVREKDAKQYLREVEESRKAAPFPFIWSDIDCLTYFPVTTGRQVSEVLEITKRPLIPTAKALGVRPTSISSSGKLRWKTLKVGEKFNENNLPSGAPNTVDCKEFWTADNVYYVLDKEIVDQRSHKYKRPPYFDFGSYTTSAREPDKRYRSAVSNIRNLVKSLNVFLSMTSNWGYHAAWPFWKEDQTVPGGSTRKAGQDAVNQIEPGTIVRGISPLEVPSVAKDLDKMIQLLMAEIDRASLSAVMYGYGGGTTSGYQVASLQSAAQLVLKPVLRNAGICLGQLFGFLLYMVEHVIGDKVYVYGRGDAGKTSWLVLGPKNINGYYHIQAELKPRLPLDQIAQQDAAIRLYQANLIDPETALAKAGEGQPEEITDKVLAYQWLRESGASMKVAEDAARRRGLLPEAPAPPELPPGMPSGIEQALGIGGPGIGSAGPIEVPLPGAGLPLQPPGPPMANMPIGIQRRPGGVQEGGPLP